MSDTILRVERVSKSFGGVHAVRALTFGVAAGEVMGIIGPNGAGKTTLFNLITGVFPLDGGAVFFAGEKLNGLQPHVIAAKGIARTFQNVELFERMSVVENVMVGCHPRTNAGLLSVALRLPRARREEEVIRAAAMEVLAFVGLRSEAHLPAAALPFGHQRLVEIGRALAMQPRLLLLDEPASGLNPAETAGLGELLQRIRGRGITVLLVEHDMSLTMEVCDRILVMDSGRNLAEGTPRQVQEDPRVIAAYLGEDVLA